jgi:hypothetical protein
MASGGQRAHARGGELDGQRHAVEAPADLVDGRAVGRGEREAGLRRPRPLGEQLGRLVVGEGRHEPRRLAGTPSASRLVARMRSAGHARSSASTPRRPASTTCSQLSSTSQHRVGADGQAHGVERRDVGRAGEPEGRPASCAGTWRASATGVRSTHATRDGGPPSARRPGCPAPAPAARAAGLAGEAASCRCRRRR